MNNSTNAMPNKKKKDTKRNYGGRPKIRPGGSHGSKTNMVKWKKVEKPTGGQNHYEVSNTGQVRRRLKSGTYKAVKVWVQGSSYGCVYLYGFPHATRHRKKVYVHRLVAEHFVSGKKPLEVVHHKRGPMNNNAADLEWVSVAENNLARKYLDPTTAKPKVRTKKKVKDSVKQTNAVKPVLKDKKKPEPEKTEDKPYKLPEAEKLPDKDEFIPGTDSLEGKIKYLVKQSKEFRTHYKLARDHLKSMGIKLKSNNISDLFKQATGKSINIPDKRSPFQWKTKLISVLHSIKTRLKV